jgi:AcrR family transcriptional regulator
MSPRTQDGNAKVRAVTRQKILEHGLAVFARRGFHAAAISDIAREAGMSHGLVYHYFKTKEAVFLELAGIALEQSVAATRAAAQTKGRAWDRIRNIVAMLYENAFRGESPHFFYLMVQANILAPTMPELAALLGRHASDYNDILVPLIRVAQRAGQAARGNPVLLSMNFWSLIQGLALAALQAPPGMPITSPEIILNILKK